MRDKHSIIFDPVRIEKVESIYLDAGGEKATVDSYRWTGHEYGNVSEFDSDDRLSPRKIEVKFKPLPPTSDFALLAGGATFLTNLRVQKGLGQLIDNLSEKLETHFGSLKLYGGLHNTAHFLLRNDPASETHAHLVEKIFFDADVIDTMVNEFYSPFLFFKGVKPPKLKGKANDLYGDSYHTASINAVAYMLGDYIKTEHQSVDIFPITRGDPSPVQTTTNALLEVYIAAQYISASFEASTGVKLTDVDIINKGESPYLNLKASHFMLRDEGLKFVEHVMSGKSAGDEIVGFPKKSKITMEQAMPIIKQINRFEQSMYEVLHEQGRS